MRILAAGEIMKKAINFGIFVILALMFSISASAVELKDTQIDYFDYREVVPGEAGVVYKIKITNLGDSEKTYILTPETDAVKALGTYRIDPSDKVTVSPEMSETLYFYLALERDVTARISIPVHIASGSEETTIELAARSIGPFQAAKKGLFSQIINIAFYFLIAVIIIALLVRLFRKKKKDDEAPEIETYY